jgi:hypothetical protein
MQQPSEKDTVSRAHTSHCDWNSIDWKQANEYVRKLRQAIFRATKDRPRILVDLVNCLSRVR